jgi:acyl-[acyl-carrier-protein] desaturase
MAEHLTDPQLLHELEPVVERLYQRHLETTKEWFPHHYIPYDRATSYQKDHDWQESDSAIEISSAARSALIVNLLTEDNLPYYFRTIDRMFGSDGVWGEWSKRWTAEEGRHSMAIYGYLMATRAVDPVELERARMVQVGTGQVPEPPSAPDGFVYVALQELATRISHHNTGKILQDTDGYEVMKRVAADENLHHLFYRDLGAAALALDPSNFVQAVERQVVGFEMPGTGIPEFDTHAKAIARSKIYDFDSYLNGVLIPVLERNWRIFELTGLNNKAKKSLEVIHARMEKLGKIVARQQARFEAVVAV